MKRVAFLNDTSSWYHWGCTGTSEAIKELLASRGYDVTPVPIQAMYACKPAPQTIADFDSPQFFNQFFHNNLAVTGPILQSDIVLINGEGSLHGLSHIVLVLLYLAYVSKRICKKNVQIINHSCYPDHAASAELSTAAAVYRGVYQHLDFVAVREHVSQEVLKSLGVEATLAFDCLPLYIRNHVVSPPPQRSRTIIIAGSVAWRAEGIKALAAYMREMAADGHVIQVLTGAKADPAQDDAEFLKAIQREAPGQWVHVNARSMQEWLEAIRSAALLISGRFHYTIAASVLETPCIVLDSNTPKNRAICEEGGLPEPLPYTAENLQELLRERTKAILSASKVQSELRQVWCERAEKNFLGIPPL